VVILTTWPTNAKPTASLDTTILYQLNVKRLHASLDTKLPEIIDAFLFARMGMKLLELLETGAIGFVLMTGLHVVSAGMVLVAHRRRKPVCGSKLI
jgi:hypothetical protein